jgi:hypothetical protein
VASGLGFKDHRIVTMRLYYWPALHVDDEHAAQDEAELEDFLNAPQNWTYDFGERWLPVQVVAPPAAAARPGVLLGVLTCISTRILDSPLPPGTGCCHVRVLR